MDDFIDGIVAEFHIRVAGLITCGKTGIQIWWVSHKRGRDVLRAVRSKADAYLDTAPDTGRGTA